MARLSLRFDLSMHFSRCIAAVYADMAVTPCVVGVSLSQKRIGAVHTFARTAVVPQAVGGRSGLAKRDIQPTEAVNAQGIAGIDDHGSGLGLDDGRSRQRSAGR